MAQLKALIFDVDGTLAETECEGHRVAFNRAFKDFDLDWHWSINFYGTLLTIGGGRERIQHYVETYHPPLPQGFKVTDIPRLHLRKNEHYQQILQQGEISLRPGVLRLLTEARRQRCSLAIATTSSLTNTLGLLHYHLGDNAAEWFDVIGAGDIVPAKKPAPDIYCYVLKQLQLSPENCLVFEDSDIGITAARAAGLKTVMTLNSYTRSHRQDQATLVVDHLGEPRDASQLISGTLTKFPGFIDLRVCRQVLDCD